MSGMNVLMHNMQSMFTSRQLGITNTNKAKSTERLSSGFRINRASDDAAGLTISEKMRHKIRGLSQGIKNSQEGVSMIQVGDGALAEVQDMLHRLTELSIKSANGTNTQEERAAIQKEIHQIQAEIDRIGDSTEFNTIPLFRGKDIEIYEDTGEPVQIGEVPTSSWSLKNVSLGEQPFNPYSNPQSLQLQARISEGSGSGAIPVNLLYTGSYSGSTSFSKMRVNGIDIDLYSGSSQSFSYVQDSYKADTVNNSWSRKFQYKNGNEGLDLELTQVVKSVNVSDDEKKYELSYSLKNNGNKDIDAVFMFHADTSYGGGGGSNGDAIENYYISGNPIKDPMVFSKADSLLTPYSAQNKEIGVNYGGIPSSFSINGTYLNGKINDSLAFSEKISFQNTSDIMNLSMGFYGNVDDFSSFTSSGLEQLFGDGNRQDLGFSVIYNMGTISPGGNKTEGLDYGILSTGKDPNLNNLVVSLDRSTVKRHESQFPIWIQAGDYKDNGMNITFGEMNTEVMGINYLDVTTERGAKEAIEPLNKALEYVSDMRSTLGAQQNRLEHTIANEGNIVENTQKAESTIRDTDMAKEMVLFSRDAILQQAGQSMLAQANQNRQGILKLLQ